MRLDEETKQEEMYHCSECHTLITEIHLQGLALICPHCGSIL